MAPERGCCTGSKTASFLSPSAQPAMGPGRRLQHASSIEERLPCLERKVYVQPPAQKRLAKYKASRSGWPRRASARGRARVMGEVAVLGVSGRLRGWRPTQPKCRGAGDRERLSAGIRFFLKLRSAVGAMPPLCGALAAVTTLCCGEWVAGAGRPALVSDRGGAAHRLGYPRWCGLHVPGMPSGSRLTII